MYSLKGRLAKLFTEYSGNSAYSYDYASLISDQEALELVLDLRDTLDDDEEKSSIIAGLLAKLDKRFEAAEEYGEDPGCMFEHWHKLLDVCGYKTRFADTSSLEDEQPEVAKKLGDLLYLVMCADVTFYGEMELGYKERSILATLFREMHESVGYKQEV